jgi:hypothetical protein
MRQDHDETSWTGGIIPTHNITTTAEKEEAERFTNFLDTDQRGDGDQAGDGES